MSQKVRHIVSLSGGKDSTALAILLRKKEPDLEVEYVFCDTGEELPETYSYLEKLQTYLGKPIVYLRAEKTWDEFIEAYSGYLPSAKNRWCTVQMKIVPFERYVGDDHVVSYIGIRADENREGYISSKTNIKARYPFREYGINKEDVMRILDESGLGLPKYYEWRTRSGCYFCFFQRRKEWLGLKERHPDLFEKARQYERINADGSEQKFTWIQGQYLEEVLKDEEGIKKRHDQYEKRIRNQKFEKSNRLLDVFREELVFEEALDEEDDSEGCLVCHI
ncbi:MAG: phosphoadenosine phosphosulfate reductase family protein [Leptospira sp.]|nr:phosphoadenosine phosphosulfate reductase family protein [Leptospira sp.]